MIVLCFCRRRTRGVLRRGSSEGGALDLRTLVVARRNFFALYVVRRLVDADDAGKSTMGSTTSLWLRLCCSAFRCIMMRLSTASLLIMWLTLGWHSSHCIAGNSVPLRAVYNNASCIVYCLDCNGQGRLVHQRRACRPSVLPFRSRRLPFQHVVARLCVAMRQLRVPNTVRALIQKAVGSGQGPFEFPWAFDVFGDFPWPRRVSYRLSVLFYCIWFCSGVS